VSNSARHRGSIPTLALVAVAAALLSLAFRSLIWGGWVPTKADEPYGVSDILDGLFGLVVLGLCAACLVVGAVTAIAPRWRSPRRAVYFIATGALLPLIFYFAHANVPTFDLWH
jgi:hypothetical protein